MNFDLILDFLGFALVTSITPGPNNLLLTASGLSFGFTRTVPQIFGIAVGVTIMSLAIGLGLGALFQTFPVLQAVLKIIAVIYLTYLVWAIAMADQVDAGGGRARPMRFIEAALFQWINPKAWLMMVSAVAVYTPQRGFFVNLLIVSGLFGVTALVSSSVWASVGRFMRDMLRSLTMVKLFNWGMAALLAATVIPLIVEIIEDFSQ